MQTKTTMLMLWLAVAGVLLGSAPAMAQQITGTPGAPSATQTIDGRYLPNPPAPFGGEITSNALQSSWGRCREWCAGLASGLALYTPGRGLI